MTEIHYTAFGWCVKNNIKVYIVPIQYSKECYVECDIRGKKIKSPITYKNQKIGSHKVWELYLHLYKTLNNEASSKH